MIEDSIKAVKAAESQANDMLADARRQADELILKAKDDAALRVKKAEEDSRAQAAEELDRARIAGESVLDEAGREAAVEVEALKAVTNGKISDAIAEVMNALF